jgi:hypothetical protein
MVERTAPPAEIEMPDGQAELPALKGYLETLMSGLHPAAATPDDAADSGQMPERVFEVLTSRDFCYLSKTRVAPYRPSILAHVVESQRRASPVHFFYDLGGGYHASTRPGHEDVSFEVGLAELFVLSQISCFSARATRFYPHGVRFSLVIDNMCALLINDIPLSSTLAYCDKLRRLIRELRLDALVDVLVESEHISTSDFDRAQDQATTDAHPVELTRKQHDNVERFLGRPCDETEASERTRKYLSVIDVSERLLQPLIEGVHMTQRATDATICFRPFPGADSRIQCGEVVLTRNSKQKLHPILMTSSNRPGYSCRRYRFPDLFSTIPHVTYAELTPR